MREAYQLTVKVSGALPRCPEVPLSISTHVMIHRICSRFGHYGLIPKEVAVPRVMDMNNPKKALQAKEKVQSPHDLGLPR